MSQKKYDVVVIGLGPAGTVASVQLKREGFSVVAFEAEKVGGTLNDASIIENLPVCGEAVQATEIIKNMETSLASYRVEIARDLVVRIQKKKEFYVVGLKKVIVARCVIIASGLIPKKYPDLDEKKNIFYRARDVGEIRGLTLGIVGGGDAAFDAALSFSGSAEKVYIVCRGTPKAIPPLIERAREKTNIHIFDNIGINKISVGVKVHIQLENGTNLESDKLLVSIGKERKMDILPLELKRKFEGKKLIPQELCKGMYAAGDFLHPEARYISTALGSGIQAALLATKYLRGE